MFFLDRLKRVQAETKLKSRHKPGASIETAINHLEEKENL